MAVPQHGGMHHHGLWLTHALISEVKNRHSVYLSVFELASLGCWKDQMLSQVLQ